ncbi:hypothetical protein B0E49_10790 [Polaromonas sp. C04]|nr:hypothetical protein B0E49_10790 [Polaromonas sp. C04]
MLCGLALLAAVSQAPAAVPLLATAPLQTSASTQVYPNIFYVLDDSGSMTWDFLPDTAGSDTNYSGTAQLIRNSRYNGVYYDPATTYTPPSTYGNSYSYSTNSGGYPSMNSTNSSAWTKVPYDGFGKQTANTGNPGGLANLFTTSSSGTTQNLTTGQAVYYTFVPGEYCSEPARRNCVAQTTASGVYQFPAYVRWCSDSALTNCQATRFDTAINGKKYIYARYPGQSGVPGQNIKVTIQSSNNSYPYPNTTTKASTRIDCAAATCTYNEEMTNFANWWAYYRTRMQMTKSAVSIAFAGLSSSYRLGYMSLNNNTTKDFLDVGDPNNTGSFSSKMTDWYNKFLAATPAGGTPLRGALSIAGRYYANKMTKINGQSTTDPMQYACQRNYTIASTDGYWNAGTDSNNVQINGSTQIGDQDGTSSSEVRPYLDGNSTANTLADVTEYYYKTDLRTPALSNNNGVLGTDVASNNIADLQQRMYTSTIGLGVSGYMQYQSNYATATSGDYYNVAQGNLATSTSCLWQATGTACNWPTPVGDTQTAVDDLWHAAVNGRGTYYSAGNPTALKTGLANFIQSVNAATSSGAAVSTSSPNLTQGSNYVFASTFRSGQWFGELARYSINGATGAISANADWSESGTAYSNATTQAFTPALLDTTSPGARNILTYDPTNPSATAGLIPFKWGSMTTAMQKYFQMASIGSASASPLSQMCPSGATCLDPTLQIDSSASSATGAGGLNLVNFLRGDRSNEGPDATTYYFQRTHVLGDIVDSQAAYVQAPSFGYADIGYAAFRSSNASRQGMVYVGANDGMLHAFDASTGAEKWAYVPSMLLPNLYKLADKNYASKHQFFVDGSPQVADVQFSDGWHTILLGGLANGGRGYYALDVTTPAAPTVLWEFTNDTTKASPYISDTDLGYSYGPPVVTKLSDGTWVALVTSGYNNVTDPTSGAGAGSGHGILWVLNAQTGAIIKKIDTGIGSTTSPSGLAKIAAFQANVQNNTAPRVYGGDLNGNLWRFDISALTASGGTAKVQLLATLVDAVGNPQPITATPQLGMSGSNALVFVGTGSYLSVSDIATTQVQSIYGIKDPLTTSAATGGIYGSPRAKTCTSTVTTNCFAKQTLTDSANSRTAVPTTSAAVNLNTMYGWFEDLPESGERVDTDPQLQLGTLVFTSNIPNGASACSVGGSSYLNYVNYATGLAVPGSTVVGVLLSNGTTTALASAPTLVRTTTGKIVAITNLSNGTTLTSSVPTGGGGLGTRRISWRELITGQ